MFLTDYFVDYLMVKHGFRIKEKHFYEEHSVYYTVEKLDHADPAPHFENKYDEYRALFMDFIHYHEELVVQLNKKILAHNGEVFLFGAHIFSQYLIEFGLDTSRIVAILDNSKLKQGKRLYGSTLHVESPDVVAKKKNPAVILKVGPYRNEIFSQLKALNPEIAVFE